MSSKATYSRGDRVTVSTGGTPQSATVTRRTIVSPTPGCDMYEVSTDDGRLWGVVERQLSSQLGTEHFKVGDKVKVAADARYVGGFSGELSSLGIRDKECEVRTGPDDEGDYWVESADSCYGYVDPQYLTLVEPEKPAPKVGDKVRVTVEGVVREGHLGTYCYTAGTSTYVRLAGATSVEVIEPATPPLEPGEYPVKNERGEHLFRHWDGTVWRYRAPGYDEVSMSQDWVPIGPRIIEDSEVTA